MVSRLIPTTRKAKRKKVASYTPIAAWIIQQCENTINPHTNKPYSWRQASLQAGLDHGAISRYADGAQPVSNALYKLAIFFSVYPDHVINPDYLLHLADHRFDPSAPELLKPEDISDEEASAILEAIDPELTERLSRMIRTEDGRAKLKTWLRDQD